MKKIKDRYYYSKILYIIEAALEYFILDAVNETYLANITLELGMPNYLTSIISSFISLGCGFQIFSIFLATKKPVKNWVTGFETLSLLFLALIYFLPSLQINHTLRIILCVIFVFLGRAIHNIVNSSKINWFMNLISDKKRGSFTSLKEIISLFSGMIVIYFYGEIISYYRNIGDINTAFIYMGIILLIFTFGHLLTQLFSKEKIEEQEKINLNNSNQNKYSVKNIFTNKVFLLLLITPTLWKVASTILTSHMGIYQNTLGFTDSYKSLIIIISSLSRALISIPLGIYADKKSFSKMLIFCLIIEMMSFGIATFITIDNGFITYPIYKILYSVGLAGLNSGFINLLFDYVEKKDRTAYLATQTSITGIIAFLANLAMQPLCNYIDNQNSFLGLAINYQQVLAFISLIIVTLSLLYHCSISQKLKDFYKNLE